MTQPTMDPHNPQHPSHQLGLEASQWLVRLQDTQPDPHDPYFDAEKRNAAFLEWITRSPEHVVLFLDTYETYRRLGNIDPRARIKIDALLEARHAEVIQLFGPLQRVPQPNYPRRVLIGLAAGVAMLAITGVFSWKLFAVREYATSIGEQRTCKLEDGSFIYLNTDSRVKVDFTKTQRHIELTRGEALFAVEHDPGRPFVVTASGVNIRAVGTQFNVRRRSDSTDVTVVEGVVQVTAAGDGAAVPPAASDSAHPTSPLPSVSETRIGGEDSPAGAGSSEAMPTRLAAGEELLVSSGHLNKHTRPNVAEALSWRERRLVFQDTPLADVAAEFNRYNLRKIRVEGPIEMELTGAFDADRPTALILYAIKQTSLDVQQDGDNWVIRAK
jgi:transmembrane sensor